MRGSAERMKLPFALLVGAAIGACAGLSIAHALGTLTSLTSIVISSTSEVTEYNVTGLMFTASWLGGLAAGALGFLLALQVQLPRRAPQPA